MDEPKKTFVEQMRQALAKKHSATHPEVETGESNPKSTGGRAPARTNKPQKRVTGRGR